ncbi:MAG: AIM24 family protein [Actinomycetales bacterium]
MTVHPSAGSAGTVLNPMTLPDADNVPDNPYAFSIAMNPGRPWFLSKGAMIAYYGNITFTAIRARGLEGHLLAMVSHQFSSPLYAQDWVVGEGHGKLVVGDRGYDINSYDLETGNLTIKAANLLAFDSGLALNQSIVPGFVTLVGTGKFLASSSGEVMFAEPPLRVDPEALLGWADCPSPSHHYDAGWMQGFLGGAIAMLGGNSGEERQFDFTGEGTVLVQSSEAVRSDSDVARMIEDQLHMLGADGLRRLQTTISSRLGEGGH